METSILLKKGSNPDLGHMLLHAIVKDLVSKSLAYIGNQQTSDKSHLSISNH
jgi:hypothetical protein